MCFTALMDAPTRTHTETAETNPVFTHRQVLRVVLGILLCILLAAIDQTVMVPAVPSIAADLNGFSHLAWIVSAYLVTSTAATPIFGRLSDIHGRRAVLLPAIVVFVIASVLCALAQSLPQLIAARALQGLGGGGLMSMAQAAIADVVSPRERGRYQGYMAGTWGVASIAGPILGGWITDYISWRWIFWFNLPLGIAAYLLSSRALKILVVRRQKARIDWVGAALLTCCITSSLLLLSWGGSEYPWDAPEIIGLCVLSVALLAAFVAQSRAVAEPLLPPQLFAGGVFVRGVSIASLTSMAMFGAIFLLPLFFQLVRGADAAQAGTLIVPYLGSSCFGGITGGLLARRIGRTKLIIQGGIAGAALGYAMLATIGPETDLWFVMVGQAIVGFAIGLTMPSTLVAVQNAVPRKELGSATGALLFLRSIGGAVGSTMAGTILSGMFALGLTARGEAQLDLGAMHGSGSAAQLGAVTYMAARDSLAVALHWSFAGCAVTMVLAFVVCWGLRDIPLRR
jgi:EmrB/QacA subfamily drug resistance transporter